jgi:hypothetical protein
MQVVEVFCDFVSLKSRSWRRKMPNQRVRLTKTEDQDYRARLLRLEQMGVAIGCVDHASPEPDRFILKQTDREFARMYELPSGEVAVVIPATLTVLISGIVITDLEMTTSLDDYPLDLSDPTEWSYYQDVIAGLPRLRPTVLNRWLTSALPLRPCRVEGVIFANDAWDVVPPEYPDEALVEVKLFLSDERRNEKCVDFEVRLDRSLKSKYEYLRKRLEVPRLIKRHSLFECEERPLADQTSVSPEESIKSRPATGDDDAELQRPN